MAAAITKLAWVQRQMIQDLGREPTSQELAAQLDMTPEKLIEEPVHAILGVLSEREAGVVSLRFGLADGRPRTLDEIGKVYGLTRERIRQVESKTLSKLRHPSLSRLLRDCLD